MNEQRGTAGERETDTERERENLFYKHERHRKTWNFLESSSNLSTLAGFAPNAEMIFWSKVGIEMNCFHESRRVYLYRIQFTGPKGNASGIAAKAKIW